MSPVYLLRLALDLLAAGLLLFGLAYWWLGKGAHELAGTAFFSLVIVHNLFNRRFYGSLARTRKRTRGIFNTGVTLALLITMITLLITSVLISNALSGIMPSFGSLTIRQIHTLAAYWALVIVSVHLGLRWGAIMAAARILSNMAAPSTLRSWALRLVAGIIAAHGVWSSFVLGLGIKLMMQVTLDWWSFEESVAGFFVHAIAIAGLYITLTYYGLMGMRHLGSRRVQSFQFPR